MSDNQLKAMALDYHANPVPGKMATQITKPTATQQDLALAYSPGVAEPVREIVRDPEMAYAYTQKPNLVGVITNGTAVLGLGDVGPLASKPVMEGKGVLLKCFAGIDVFDIEVDAQETADFVDTVARIAPTFGAINLEDIRGPQCFDIEAQLKARLDIPVFHDDQHGTAITVAAGLLNALELQGKQLSEAKMVCLGAGAAGIATMRLLKMLGANPNHILMIDRKGVIYTGREGINAYKEEFAVDTKARTLEDACCGADVFIGVSGPNLLTTEMLLSMAEKPIVFALSNPDPEIAPHLAHKTREDLILATGRSDFPNQVNNVVCFPYIFKGALSVRASDINDAMKIACVHAIRDLAKMPIDDSLREIYPDLPDGFGPGYILPTPFDPRLAQQVPAAVAKAAVESGVAKA